jgi:lipid-binding SYLF domain-containing protein
MKTREIWTSAILVGLGTIVTTGGGGSPATAPRNEARVAMGATEVLREITVDPRTGISRNILNKAHAVAILPGMFKGGFIGGIALGRGLVMIRDPETGWSNPVMIHAGGGSVGFQAGAQSTDLILVFTTPRGIERFLEGRGKFRLGADISAAAGPVGTELGAGTDLQFRAEILTYARTRGLFAGVSIAGLGLSIDWNGNADMYGAITQPYDIWKGKDVKIPAYVTPLIALLNQMTGIPPKDQPAGEPRDGDAKPKAKSEEPFDIFGPGKRES